MAVKVRYIDRIGSSYRYRRVVPPALRANLGGQRVVVHGSSLLP